MISSVDISGTIKKVKWKSGILTQNNSGGFGNKTWECRPRETGTDPATALLGIPEGSPVKRP